MSATPPLVPAETTYLDRVDPDRVAGLATVEEGESGRPLDAIFDGINRNMFATVCPDENGKTPHGILAASLDTYRDFLERLLGIPGARFLTARDLSTRRPAGTEYLMQMRHDVDADIVTGIELARIEHALGIQSTFFILHTSSYFGELTLDTALGRGTFLRHESMLDVYREVQGLGHEIALHTDALTLYQQFNVDGAAILQSDLNWLRANGLHVTGTAPHNNSLVYGADNSAIFEGRNIRPGHPASARAVIHHNRWAPLQQLNERKLHLTYESNDLFLRDETTLDFFSITNSDQWWHYHQDTHARPNWDVNASKAFWGDHHDIMRRLRQLYPNKYRDEAAFWTTHDGVIDRISLSTPGRIIVFAVHPEFYGLRRDERSGPIPASRRSN